MAIQQLQYAEYAIAFVTIFTFVFLIVAYLNNRGRMKEALGKPKRLPEVTVLVPAYNEEEYLAGTLKSLLALDYPKSKLKIVVINDGSTDGTGNVAAGFARFGVGIISKKNSGKADSLNVGLGKVRTELVATMDADSYVAPDALAKIVGHFEDRRVGAVASCVLAKSSGNFLGEIQRLEYMFTIFTRRILDFLNCVTVTPGPFSVFRTRALKKIGGYDPKSLVEDQEVALNMQQHGWKIRTAPEAMVYSETPKTFQELMGQRVRWQRGGLYNALKYRFLIGLKWGDLGVVIMPNTLLGYLFLTIVPIIVLISIMTSSIYASYLGWEGVRLSIGPLHIMAALMLLAGFAWLYYGMNEFYENERLSFPTVAVFIIAYPILLFIFWLFAAYMEVTKQAKSW
ncbi:glycosyltransferase family 2 protein [Candidatus Parvarchaeota archaeon]|nr:glycosyltransferase family 2 protein [Candidatus Parvarchaeota archaeon]